MMCGSQSIVKIKPLEWRRGYCDDQVTILQATIIGGIYQIRLWKGLVYLDTLTTRTVYPSLDDAKAAAQRDHELLVRSVISPQEETSAQWLPIAQADTDVAYVHVVGDLRIGNSYPVWVRDEDGRVYQALWSECGKKAYWWDIEGESPVDPVEFMPHPLDASVAGLNGKAGT